MAGRPLALVVGATRGIGLGVVKEFASRSWDVIATARKPHQASALRDLAARYRQQITIQAFDMDDPDGIDTFAAGATSHRLDAVLINAGVAGPDHRSADRATPAETGALMFTNAIGPIRLARQLAGAIVPGTGVLAFSSSVMGSVALNTGGHELYRASKAALNSLTRGLAHEQGHRRLAVLSLHPGWVRTDMGGPHAAVSIEDSARGLVDVILAQRGHPGHRFLDYRGQEIAW